MNDQEIKAFLQGDFRVECFRIELKREGDHPIQIVGPGSIEQDENYVLNFRIHIDADSARALLNDLNRPRQVGKIIPCEDYFTFTAHSYNLPVWNSEIAGIGCSLGLANGGIAHGQLGEMVNLFELPTECTKDSANLWLRESLEFPETGFTETEVKRSGKARRRSSNRDHANFAVGEEEFELLSNPHGTVLYCSLNKEGIDKNKHIRIQADEWKDTIYCASQHRF